MLSNNITNENKPPGPHAMSRESRSRQQKGPWRERISVFLIGHNKTSAERVTRRYLEDLNPASCIKYLDQALRQLLHGIKDFEKVFSKYATISSSGKRVWDRNSWARYINAEIPAVAIGIPLLWYTFTVGAYFPLSPPSNEPEIDLKAFRRAFAFLVSRGYEILGAKSNG